MKSVKILLLILVAVVIGAILAWQVFSGWAVEYARRLTERELATALGTPVSVPVLRLSLAPPVVEVEGMEVGAGGAAARATTITARLLPYTSLLQLRPVMELTAAGLRVDSAHLRSGELGGPAGGRSVELKAVTPFRLRRVALVDAQVRLHVAGEPWELRLGKLIGHVEASVVEGRVSFGVDAEELLVSRGTQMLGLHRVRLSGGQEWRGWVLRSLDVSGDGVSIKAAGQKGWALRHRLRADLALDRLAVIDDRFAPLGGRLRLDAALTGKLDDPEVEAALQVEHISIEGRVVGEATAAISRRGDRLELSSMRFTGLGGELTSVGSVALRGPMPYELRADWRGIDIDWLAQLAADVRMRSLEARGSAKISGSLEPLVLTAEGDGVLVAEPSGSPLEFATRGGLTRGGGWGEISASVGPRNSMRVHLDATAGDEIGGVVELQVNEPAALQPFGAAEGLPVTSGPMALSGEIRGTRGRPVFAGTIVGEAIEAWGAVIERVDGRFAVDPNVLRIDRLALSLGGGTVTVEGSFDVAAGIQNDWNARLEDVATDSLMVLARDVTGRMVPLTGGALSGTMTGSGGWSQLALAGDARLDRFALGGERFERLALDMKSTWPQWDIRAQLVHSEGERLDAELSGLGFERVSADLQSTSWSLERLRGAGLEELGGEVVISARLEGPLRELSGRANVEANGLSMWGRQVGDVAIKCEAARGDWEIQASLLGDTLRVEGNVSGKTRFPFKAEARWSDSDLARLASSDPAMHIHSSGSLRVAGHLQGLELVGGDASIEALRVENGPYRLSASGPITLRGERGEFTVEPVELAGNGTQLRASGTVRTDGSVRLSAQGAGDLRLLEMVGKPIESARGTFEFEAGVRRGAGEDWRLEGKAVVADAALDAGLPVVFTGTSGHFRFDGDEVRIEQLNGRVGGGTFSIEGRVDRSSGPALTWQLTQAGADVVESLEFEASGSGTIDGTWDDLTVGGEVKIDRLLYDRQLKLKDLVPLFNRALARPHQRDTGQERLELDLHLFAPGELFVENNVAKLEAQGDLRITGTARRPVLSGQIGVLEGQVAVGSRTFELTSGSVGFRPEMGIVASLNITAESVITTPDAWYTVGVRVEGTTDNYRVLLSADDPELSQTDIASLIAFGKTTSGLQSAGSSFSVYDVVEFAGEPLAKQLERETQLLLPVDRIEFEPAFSRTTGAFEPQLTIGKDLTDDLRASVSRTFGVEARNVVQAEYQLAPRFSGELEWESETNSEQGAFGGGLKFRHEFWRMPDLLPFSEGGGQAETDVR